MYLIQNLIRYDSGAPLCNGCKIIKEAPVYALYKCLKQSSAHIGRFRKTCLALRIPQPSLKEFPVSDRHNFFQGLKLAISFQWLPTKCKIVYLPVKMVSKGIIFGATSLI